MYLYILFLTKNLGKTTNSYPYSLASPLYWRIYYRAEVMVDIILYRFFADFLTALVLLLELFTFIFMVVRHFECNCRLCILHMKNVKPYNKYMLYHFIFIPFFSRQRTIASSFILFFLQTDKYDSASIIIKNTMFCFVALRNIRL